MAAIVKEFETSAAVTVAVAGNTTLLTVTDGYQSNELMLEVTNLGLTARDFDNFQMLFQMYPGGDFIQLLPTATATWATLDPGLLGALGMMPSYSADPSTLAATLKCLICVKNLPPVYAVRFTASAAVGTTTATVRGVLRCV